MAKAKMFGGQSMVGALKRVLVCPPEVCGWGQDARIGRWPELGYTRRPDVAEARKEHAAFAGLLESAGCEVLMAQDAAGLTLDAIYVHDASFVTDAGAVCLRMGKPERAAEPCWHRSFYEADGIPLLGVMEKSGTIEAGDVVWLDAGTLLVGRGYRTNEAGIRWLTDLLLPLGISVVPAPLPHARGPGSCLHLMSLMSMLDDGTVLVDLPLLAVETVELLRSMELSLVEIDPLERGTLAANVLSLGNGRLAALEDNPSTNERLIKLGFEVTTFRGAEIAINGGGGPTCLTRPLLRD